MKDELISFETAKLAKKKGFDWECFYSYSTKDDDITMEDLNTCEEQLTSTYDSTGNFKFTKEDIESAIENGYSQTCFAPTQSLLQKWLREKHDIDINISGSHNIYRSIIKNNEGSVIVEAYTEKDEIKCYIFDDYEKALENILEKGLKLIKNEKE